MAPLLKCGVFILLAMTLSPVSVEAEWILAPRTLEENVDYTGLEYIAKIHSDKASEQTKIYYYLTGPGVDLPPQRRFSINAITGYVKVHEILDREDIAFYHLKGIAKFTDGTYAEKDIDLKIAVGDRNDNPPIIRAKQIGYVNESSAAGTIVMKIIATDADEPNTIRSQIHYSIVQETNTAGMFLINSQTGEVMVQKSTLDRETKATYKLTISASDMGGVSAGNTGTAEIEIVILDINDNIPTLEKETYEGKVEENTINVEVMRIRAVDLDLSHTDSWLAVYEIISGNEAGYFNITTDSKTNEGIIMIHKALDYEELKVLNLKVAVRNKAEYNFGSQPVSLPPFPKTYPIKINVVNQREGPRFHPTVKVVSVSEDHTSISTNTVITNYAAIDSDTLQTATNVKYVKIYDMDNWLIIDENTADIKLNKLPDRESKFLVNGTYYAKIICVTKDSPSVTATGTIAIQVEDSNDHCPELTTTTHTMCLDENVIYATAVDKDEFPNSAPFEFTVIEESSKGKWTVEHLNKTTAIIRDQAKLWPGIYKVALEVRDQQGKSCIDVQMMDVVVCTCLEGTKSCAKSTQTKTSGFGAAGVLLLLLGLLLLLLVPLLLLFCLCGGALGDFKPIPFDTKQGLISYHTEGQGEDKEVPLLQVPVEVDGTGGYGAQGYQEIRGVGVAGGGAAGGGAAGGGGAGLITEDLQSYGQHGQYIRTQEELIHSGMATGHVFSGYRGGVFDGMALSEQFLDEYYSSKANHAANHSQQKDALLVYDYEGQESLAGSVGCCSLLENDNDLAFLDDLGPKFKTLAEICQGSNVVIESVDVRPVRPVSPIRPSTHTHVHTHTERIRESDHVNISERDHVNINTINSSNVASGLSTVVQDKIVMPSQTLLIQQPAMYYAATPMYVVESQPQMLLVAGGTQQQSVAQVGQVELGQGLVQVGGRQGSHGVVLVDRQGGVGGVAGQVVQGLPQGTVSRSKKVLVVESESLGREQGLGQGSVEGLDISQGVQSFSLSSHGSFGSNDESLTVTPKLQGGQKLVVQQKKVLVTERNLESSSRA